MGFGVSLPRPETPDAIGFEIDPKGVSSFPERCGSVSKIGKSQAHSEMNPTRPRTQSFAAGVIKAVAVMVKTANALRNTEPFARLRPARHANLTWPFKSIADQYQNRHCGRAMDLHRPCFALVSKIALRHSQIIPICPRHATEKSSATTAVEKISLQSASIESSLVAGVAWRVEHPGWRAIALKQQRVRMILRQQARSFFTQCKNDFRQRIRYQAFRGRDAHAD